MDAFLAWIKATYDPSAVFWGWGAIALSLLGFHFVELVFPAQRGQSYRAVRFNIVATVAFLVLTPVATFLPAYVLTAAVQAVHGPWFAIDLPSLAGEAGSWRRAMFLPLFVLVPFFIYDFFFYWFHRLLHTNSWLWEQHKLHHTDEALNVTSTLRIHWTELCFRNLLIGIPMGVLFKITPVEAGVILIFTGQWGYLIHANIRLPLGPLAYVFVGPQEHRIHHSIQEQHKNRNFGAFFPIWDILFGTFHRPTVNEYPPTGVAAEQGTPSIASMLFAPFVRWCGMGVVVWRRQKSRSGPI